MNLTRAQSRLKLSAEQIVERADFKATERVSNQRSTGAGGRTIGSHEHALEVVRIAYEAIEEALPDLFRAYDAERQRLWFNRNQLDYLIRVVIESYYEGVKRLTVPSIHLLLRRNGKIIEQAMDERKALTPKRRKSISGIPASSLPISAMRLHLR